MRRLLLLVASIAAASLGLSACGAKATLDQAVDSLSASPYLQIHLTGSISGPGTSQAESVFKSLSFEVRYSDASGADLSQASTSTVDDEVIVDVAGSALADVRQLDSNLYLELNPQALSGVPGEHIPSSTLAAAQLLVGGRWFELPSSLLASIAPTPSSSSRAKDQALDKALARDLRKVIESTPYTTLPDGGLSQTGTLQSIATAVVPTIKSFLSTVPSIGSSLSVPTSLQGSYTLTLSMSGSSATGSSVTITTPGSGGDVAVGLSAVITHDDDPVGAPSGATVMTPSLLHEFESDAASGSGTF